MAKSTAKFYLTAEDKTKAGISSATRGLTGLKNQFKGLMGPVAALGGAAGLGLFIKKTAESGDQLDKMSQRTGVSVENLSRLGYAADITGSNLSAVEKSAKYLTGQMLDVSRGMGESKTTFDALGISVVDTEGKLRSVYDVYLDAAGKISTVNDETRQAAYAMEIFGSRAGQELVPMLKLGADGIKELANRSDELGNTWLTKDATAAAEFIDSVRDLKGAAGGLGRTLAIDLIPELTNGAGAMAEWIVQNREFIKDKFDEHLASIKKNAKGLQPAVQGLASGIGSMIDAFTSLPTWVQQVGIVGAIIGGKAALLASNVVIWSNVAKETKRFIDVGGFDDSFYEYQQPYDIGGNITPIKKGGSKSDPFSFGGGKAKGESGANGGFELVPSAFDKKDESKNELKTFDRKYGKNADASFRLYAERDKKYYKMKQDAINADTALMIEAAEEIANAKYRNTELTIFQMEDVNAREIELENARYNRQKTLLEAQFGELGIFHELEAATKEQHELLLEQIHADSVDRQNEKDLAAYTDKENRMTSFAQTWGGMLYGMEKNSDLTFKNILKNFDNMLTKMAFETTMAGVFTMFTGGTFLGGAGSFLSSFLPGKKAVSAPAAAGKQAFTLGKAAALSLPGSADGGRPMGAVGKAATSVVHDNSKIIIQLTPDQFKRVSTGDVYAAADVLREARELKLVDMEEDIVFGD